MMTTELDIIASASLIEVRLVAMRLIAVRVEIIRLGRKVKKCLSPKICSSPKKSEIFRLFYL